MGAAEKRTIISFPKAVRRALERKAAAADRTISELVSEAVQVSLAEDKEDEKAFVERARERTADFETVVKSLRRRGKL